MAGKTANPSVVAQARANFIKDLSAHATPLVSGSHGWVSPATQGSTARRAANGSITTAPSANWSGYADVESASDTVTNVTGSWTIPSVRCLPPPYQNADVFLANWVGIDGYSDETVEQLGTGVQCFEGVEYYYVWYEMYPSGTVEEGTTACINDNVRCPEPGDKITASVNVTSAGSGENNYTLTLTDHTRPDESFSVTQQCAVSTCLDSSGEWIVERPAVLPPFGVQILPLADFTRTYFTSGDLVSAGRQTTVQGFRNGPIYDIPMTDDTDSYYLACPDQPSPPGSLLQLTQTYACPTAVPTRTGGFEESWDASF